MLSEEEYCCIEEGILNSSDQKNSYNIDNTLTSAQKG